MECCLNSLLSSSSITLLGSSSINHRNNSLKNRSLFGSKPVFATHSSVAFSSFFPLKVVSRAVGDVHKQRSSLESLFCYDKAVPEEMIEKPVGLSLAEKNIGHNPLCTDCQAKGAVLCITCSGSGLYVDSILESQGIIVKVRCLGCGGRGNILCSKCRGRGHM